MKLVKMSLAAAVLLGASAFAIDNVKVSGDAKLYYSTSDATEGDGAAMFGQGESAADAALRLGVTGDLTKNFSFGMTANAVSTLGLDQNLVGNTWTGAHSDGNGSVSARDLDDAGWVSELWIAGTFGKTTAKLGRMELDTPFAFSEKWSIARNTFDAAVLINQDLPDTTLVGAWVGKGNGVNTLGNAAAAYDNSADVGLDGFLAAGAKQDTFMDSGAYAVAAINNSFKPLVAQAWYYNVANVADAYWLQADWDCQLVKDVKVGVQYANVSPKGLLTGAAVQALIEGLYGRPLTDSSAYAVQVAYAGVKDLTLTAAYSSADNDGTLKIANFGTDNLNGAKSKLYTEAWWAYGAVGAPGADTMKIAADYNAGFAKLTAQAISVETQATGDLTSSNLDEYAFTVSKSFGPLDTTLAYIRIDESQSDPQSVVQAYLTLNF